MCKLKNLQKITKTHQNSAVLETNYSTQNPPEKLFKNWQKCLDKSGIVETILADLSKVSDYLPHDLIIPNLAAYEFDETVLNRIQDYLSNQCQRVKRGSSFSSFLGITIDDK